MSHTSQLKNGPERYSPSKTKMSQKWYQSIALSSLLRCGYFLSPNFEGTPSCKVNKTGFSINRLLKLILKDQISALCKKNYSDRLFIGFAKAVHALQHLP
jgi:hypothetical protein